MSNLAGIYAENPRSLRRAEQIALIRKYASDAWFHGDVTAAYYIADTYDWESTERQAWQLAPSRVLSDQGSGNPDVYNKLYDAASIDVKILMRKYVANFKTVEEPVLMPWRSK